MQAIPRSKNLWIVRSLLNFSSSHFASFHSTPLCYDQRKNISKHDRVRHAIRQERANTKRSLKSILSHCGDQGATFQNDEPWEARKIKSCETLIKKKKKKKNRETDSTRKRRSRTEPLRAEKIQYHRMRRNNHKQYLAEDDDHYTETVFQAKFGGRLYTWSSDSWNETSRRSSPRFDWREAFRGTNGGQEETYKVNGADSEDAACNVGLPKDRTVLGLSPKGPLNMKDVKTAFHLLALKWHPDKHQGPTQAAAEEKFKLCVNAYKSLCSALSGA